MSVSMAYEGPIIDRRLSRDLVTPGSYFCADQILPGYALAVDAKTGQLVLLVNRGTRSCPDWVVSRFNEPFSWRRTYHPWTVTP